MDEATPIILTAVIVTVGSATIARAEQGKGPQFNNFLAGGIMGAFLFVIQAIDDNLAKLFALLVIVGQLLNSAGPVGKLISDKSKPQASVGGGGSTSF